MNALINFQYQGVQVRTTRDGVGEPLFCLTDVCKVLESSQPNKVAEAIREEFSITELNSGMVTRPDGSTISATFITEPQLYFVLFRSRSELAKPFRRWVDSEVLPSIRKTGGYKANQLSVSEKMEAAKILLAPAGIEGNQLTLALDKVYKANTGESLLAQTGVQLIAPTQERLLNPTELGKPLGLSPRTVNSRLQAKGFQVKGVAGWELTSTGKALGGVYLDTGKKHSSGVPVRQIKWPAAVATEL